ncbi:MAG: L-seryl-tRNA(Sec) selenium transferase [Actinomycetota bacterium]|nr:L-seryl-tRNA(Sec) selenium transferase [Actinomycetota bacterium]
MVEREEYLRSISPVDEVLALAAVEELAENNPKAVVTQAVRTVLAELRRSILEAKDEERLKALSLEPADLVPLITDLVSEVMSPSLRRVINATGVVVHTNLGRSILSPLAVDAVLSVASNYSTLEFDLKEGKRSNRQVHIEDLLVTITGAESAMAVNNNAAAVFLALSALANGKEVIISRGELVEIGGSFRIPDVMVAGGAILCEVGTTNKTHLKDFDGAIGPETALLLKVHTSNFAMRGFTAEVPLKELVELGAKKNIPVMHDLGSGVLIDLAQYGLSYEPGVKESVLAGADIITFSGDKLLGGPQAGLIVGKKDFIERLKGHPLARALRLDKMTLAALEETLRLYLDPAQAIKEIPTLNMMLTPQAELKKRADGLAKRLREVGAGRLNAQVMADHSKVGGGALPLEELPTFVVSAAAESLSAAAFEAALRRAETPVIVRVKDERVIFDVRTIQRSEIAEIAEAVQSILNL